VLAAIRHWGPEFPVDAAHPDLGVDALVFALKSTVDDGPVGGSVPDSEPAWRGSEIEQSQQLADLTIPTQLIGLELARTTQTVERKACELGIKIPDVYSTI
jgi:hypothetical protein